MRSRWLSPILISVPLAGIAKGQGVYFSATGSFASAGQTVDFPINVQASGINSLLLRTQASSGGTNFAGQTIAPGGIDSILTLFNGVGVQIAQNDDANDQPLTTHDSLLSLAGMGSSQLGTQPDGNYRVHLTNYMLSVGNGNWSVDVEDDGMVFADATLFGINSSGGSTLQSLAFGSGFQADNATLSLGAGTSLTMTGSLSMGVNANLILNGGTITVGSESIGGNATGPATVFQSAGLHSVGGEADFGPTSGRGGVYNLSNGTFQVTGVELLGSGNNGSATFNQTGGYHNANSIIIGYAMGSNAIYNLTFGTITASQLNIGNSGAGTLIQTGGFISANLNIGVIPGTATATFNQNGGTLNTNAAVIGNSINTSAATWSIGSLSTATVATTLTVRNSGEVFLNGGTLSAGEIDVFNNGIFNFGSGTLNLTNSAFNVGSFGLLGSSVFLSPSRILSVFGTTTISANCTLALSGGTFSTGSLVNSGGVFNFDSGALRITNSNLTIGVSGPFGTSYSLADGQRIDTTGGFNLTVDSGAIISFDGGSMNLGGGAVNNGQILFTNPLSILSGGTITSNGLIRGIGRVGSNLNNSASGEVRALSDDSMQFLAAGNNNAGSINLFGGLVEFTGTLSNAVTGRITGRGELLVRGGLSNSGSLTFSAGLSDMTGSLINNFGGKTIVTGGATATFYDPVTNSAGSEFRVSTASTAVFLSPVVGLSYFTGPGTKDFEAGASGGPVATVVGDTLVGPAGNVAAQFIHEDDLSIEGEVGILANGTASSVSRLNTLSISGGSFDLADNDLIVDVTPLAAIKSLIVAGFNGGPWNGNALTSSNARVIAADQSNMHKTALGYATATSIGVTTFDGQSVSGSSILVRYTYVGDANLDGVVNALDFNALATNFGQHAGSNVWVQGDFNYDGVVNTVDFTQLASNFSLTLPSAPIGSSLVPEPICLAIVPMLLTRWRRRR
jgi:hypothetical protein